MADKVRNLAQHFSVKLDPVKLAAFQLTIAILIMYAPGIKAVWTKQAKPRLAITPNVTPIAKEVLKDPNPIKRMAEVPSQIWDGEPQDDISLGTQ